MGTTGKRDRSARRSWRQAGKTRPVWGETFMQSAAAFRMHIYRCDGAKDTVGAQTCAPAGYRGVLSRQRGCCTASGAGSGRRHCGGGQCCLLPCSMFSMWRPSLAGLHCRGRVQLLNAPAALCPAGLPRGRRPACPGAPPHSRNCPCTSAASSAMTWRGGVTLCRLKGASL